MGDIIEISAYERRRPSDQPREDILLARKQLVSEIKEAAVKGGRVMRKDAEMLAARAAGRFREANERGLKRQVNRALAAKGIRHPERFRETGNEVTLSDKRRGKRTLAWSLDGWLAIYSVLSEQLNLNVEQELFEAFRSTEYGQRADVKIGDPVIVLTRLIESVASYVLQKERLLDYFRQAREPIGGYDLARQVFVQGRGSPVLNNRFVSGGWAGEFQEVWEAPALPGCTVAIVPRARFSGRLTVGLNAQRAMPSPAITRLQRNPLEDRPFAAVLARTKESLAPCDDREAAVELSTEIRLVIGPRTGPDDIGPLLESRSRVTLTMDGQEHRVTWPYYLWEPHEILAAAFDDGWHFITGFGADGSTPEICNGAPPAWDIDPEVGIPKPFSNRPPEPRADRTFTSSQFPVTDEASYFERVNQLSDEAVKEKLAAIYAVAKKSAAVRISFSDAGSAEFIIEGAQERSAKLMKIRVKFVGAAPKGILTIYWKYMLKRFTPEELHAFATLIDDCVGRHKADIYLSREEPKTFDEIELHAGQLDGRRFIDERQFARFLEGLENLTNQLSSSEPQQLH